MPRRMRPLHWAFALMPGCATPAMSADPDAEPPPIIDATPPIDALVADAAPVEAACHGSRNPTGEFAVTAIRSSTATQSGNTWAAVRTAYDAGIRYIEIDVRLSSDGRLIPGREDDISTFGDPAPG